MKQTEKQSKMSDKRDPEVGLALEMANKRKSLSV